MKKNAYSLLVMVALALAATFAACSDDDDDTPPVEIKLNENIVTLLPGESTTVKVLEGNGGYQVTSQNSAIATVSVNESTITVTGVMESEEDQSTTIEVVDAKNKTATIKVYVTKSVNPLKVGLEATTFEMVVDDVKSVGIISGNAPYTVESSDDATLGVTQVANNVFTITAKKVSETPVTVTLKDSKNKEIVLTATKVMAKAVTSLTIDEVGKNISLSAGETFELVGRISWQPASVEAELVYSSSPESVATIDANGKITAVGLGDATITVTVKNTTVTATANVTVKVKEKVKLNNAGWGFTYSAFAPWGGHNENPNMFDGDAFNNWWEAPNTAGDGTATGQYIQIDMKSLKSVAELAIARRCEGDWIKGGLKSVKVEYSDENTDSPANFKFLMNVNYSEVENIEPEQGQENGSAVRNEVAKPNPLPATTSMRYIRITVTGQYKGDQPCIGYVDVYGYE